MSRFKKITRIVVNAFTCLLLVLLVLVIYSKMAITFGKNGYPNYFGYTFFEVASGSMEPTLHINDVLLVKLKKDDLKAQDIIAFQGEDAVITHRILFIEGDVITVKGDKNDAFDKPITSEQVIGKVVKVFPELGIWKKVLTDPKILFGIFITLLLFDFALSYNGKDKKTEPKKKKEKEKPIAALVPNEEEKKEEPKKKIESEKLLELTRKIDIDEINKLLEGTDYKLEKKEINNIKKEIIKLEESTKSEEDIFPKFNEKERKALEYTLRLDLSEIQRKIDSKIK